MPAPARKTPAKKASAAVAARREVRGEKKPPAKITVTFRGEKFDIPVDRIAAFFMRGQYIIEFGFSPEQVSKMLFRLLGQKDSARFLDTIREGDTLDGVGAEFYRALNKAANVPNS